MKNDSVQAAAHGPLVLKDGRWTADVTAPVDLRSPAWRLGQSLFETLRVYPVGERGLYKPRAHVDRLVRAAARLGWAGCPSEEVLCDWMQASAAAFRRRFQGSGRLRLTVAWTKAQGPPESYVVVTSYTPPAGPATLVTTPVRTPWAGLGGAAKVGSRATYALAEQVAAEQGADEALLVDDANRPVEGAKSNLFVIKGERVITPPVASGILPGITRHATISLARSAGYLVHEEPVAVADLGDGSEVFLTNALWGIRSVRAVDGVDCDQANGATLRLAALYDEDVRESLTRGDSSAL